MAEYIPQMAAKMKKEAKMRALKTELANTDYVTLKVSEGVEITPEIQEKLDARAWWRKLYNEHEAEINVIYQNESGEITKREEPGENHIYERVSEICAKIKTIDSDKITEVAWEKDSKYPKILVSLSDGSQKSGFLTKNNNQ